MVQQIFMERPLQTRHGDLAWGRDWDLSLLMPELMLFLLCQQPWQGAVWGPLSLSQGGVGMTQFLPSPTHRSPRCPEYHTWSQKGGWPAALSAHTKDNGPFQPQIWPRGLGRSCTHSPPLSWGCLPSRLAGFRLNSARRRLWASVLRNWGMPSFALKQPPGLIRAEPHLRGPVSPPTSVQV